MRRSSGKSMSMSGILTRPGFKKRSKIRSLAIGSILVMPSEYATTEPAPEPRTRSEEHTSELQSHSDLVCRLLLEKKKTVVADVGLTSTYDKAPCAVSYRRMD